MYTTSNQEQSLTGVNINIHFDSSVLYPTVDNNGIDYQFDTDIQGTSIVNETKDLYNDAPTDQYIQLVYSQLNSSFPGKDLPVEIPTVHFQTQEPWIDPVTGQYIPTTLRYTSNESPVGDDFLESSTDLVASVFNLDVDGNAKVVAFSDGFMIPRKMFGDAFAGDALIDKTLPQDSPCFGQDNAAELVAHNIDALNTLI